MPNQSAFGTVWPQYRTGWIQTYGLPPPTNMTPPAVREVPLALRPSGQLAQGPPVAQWPGTVMMPAGPVPPAMIRQQPAASVPQTVVSMQDGGVVEDMGLGDEPLANEAASAVNYTPAQWAPSAGEAAFANEAINYVPQTAYGSETAPVAPAIGAAQQTAAQLGGRPFVETPTNPMAPPPPPVNYMSPGLSGQVTNFGHDIHGRPDMAMIRKLGQASRIGAFGQDVTNPNLAGASLPINTIQNYIGNYRHDPQVYHDIRNGRYQVEVTSPTGTTQRFPIVDVGPGPKEPGALDLTGAAYNKLGVRDDFKGNFRIVDTSTGRPMVAQAYQYGGYVRPQGQAFAPVSDPGALMSQPGAQEMAELAASGGGEPQSRYQMKMPGPGLTNVGGFSATGGPGGGGQGLGQAGSSLASAIKGWMQPSAPGISTLAGEQAFVTGEPVAAFQFGGAVNGGGGGGLGGLGSGLSGIFSGIGKQAQAANAPVSVDPSSWAGPVPAPVTFGFPYLVPNQGGVAPWE